MRTGEAPALTQQGEADSLQSGSCVGFAPRRAKRLLWIKRAKLASYRADVPMCSVMNSKEHRNEMSRTFYRSGN